MILSDQNHKTHIQTIFLGVWRQERTSCMIRGIAEHGQRVQSITDLVCTPGVSQPCCVMRNSPEMPQVRSRRRRRAVLPSFFDSAIPSKAVMGLRRGGNPPSGHRPFFTNKASPR